MLNECCDAYVLSSFSLLLEWHQNTGSYRRLLILVMRPVVMYYVGSFFSCAHLGQKWMRFRVYASVLCLHGWQSVSGMVIDLYGLGHVSFECVVLSLDSHKPFLPR